MPVLLGLLLSDVDFSAIFSEFVCRNNCCSGFCCDDCADFGVIIACFCCDCNKSNRLSNTASNAFFINLMRKLICSVEKPGIIF